MKISDLVQSLVHVAAESGDIEVQLTCNSRYDFHAFKIGSLAVGQKNKDNSSNPEVFGTQILYLTQGMQADMDRYNCLPSSHEPDYIRQS